MRRKHRHVFRVHVQPKEELPCLFEWTTAGRTYICLLPKGHQTDFHEGMDLNNPKLSVKNRRGIAKKKVVTS